MMTRRQTVGREGEDLAVCYLRARGFVILGRNVRIGRLELDVLARYRGALYIVEVKTIRRSVLSTPLEQCSYHKQQRLRRAALLLLARHQARYRQYHIAVLGIDLRVRPPELSWIPDAVMLDG